MDHLGHRWKDNIEMDIKQIACGVMNRILLAQDTDRWRAFVNIVTISQIP
jgi:hypothetical protein